MLAKYEEVCERTVKEIVKRRTNQLWLLQTKKKRWRGSMQTLLGITAADYQSFGVMFGLTDLSALLLFHTRLHLNVTDGATCLYFFHMVKIHVQVFLFLFQLFWFIIVKLTHRATDQSTINHYRSWAESDYGTLRLILWSI